MKALSNCCHAEVYFHSGGGGLENRNECSKCGQRCHHYSVGPQSLTEKVKWPGYRSFCNQPDGQNDCDCEDCCEADIWNLAINVCKKAVQEALEGK